MHATIFDPPPPRPPPRPGAVDGARLRVDPELSVSLYDDKSSCAPGGADSVAMGGSSVFMEDRREPAEAGTPKPVGVVIGGSTAEEASSRGSTAALRGGSVSVRSMLTFELLRECGADDAEGTSGDCDG